MNENAKKLQDDLKHSAQKVWLAGLGAVSTIEKEGSKLFDSLVAKGENFEKGGKEKVEEVREKVEETAEKARDRAGETWEKVEDRLDSVVTRVLNRVGVPSREEIATLTQRVEELTRVVEKLNQRK